MIKTLINALEEAGLEPSVDEIAGALWLAVHMSSSIQEQQKSNLPVKDDLTNSPSEIEKPAEGGVNPKGSKLKDRGSPDSNGLGKQKETCPPSIFGREPEREIRRAPNIPVYPKQSASNVPIDLSGFNTEALRVPAAAALPGKLSIGRALRPLKQQVASRVRYTLDEEATATRIAEQQRLPILIQQPALERWLDIALVIDHSPSMRLWQRTIDELQILLEQHGAFRSIRTWRLLYDAKREQTVLSAGSHLSANTARPHNPRELIDPSQRRLILIVSDCVGPIWYDGTMIEMMHIWGQENHVSIVQMLSKRLWSRSGLRRGFDTDLYLPEPAAPNSRIRDVEGLALGLCVPVTTLEAASLAQWAAACANGGPNLAMGYVFDTNIETELETSPAVQSLSTQERIDHFWYASSDSVRRLAGLLTIVPLTPPVIRLVQRTMFPLHQQQQMNIAEVLLSDLVYEVKNDNNPDVLDPDNLQFEFFEGVRDALSAAFPMPEQVQVLQSISDYIAEQNSKPSGFRALLAAATSGSVPSFVVPPESRPFAQLTARLLRKLGKQYTAIAEQLEYSRNHTPDIDASEAKIDSQPESPINDEQTIAELEASLQASLPESVRRLIEDARDAILRSVFEQLNELIRQFLIEIVDFSDSIEYRTLLLYNPYLPTIPPLPALPSFPQMVPPPFGSRNRARLEHLLTQSQAKDEQQRLKQELNRQKLHDTEHFNVMQPKKQQLQQEWNRVKKEREEKHHDHYQSYIESDEYRQSDEHFKATLLDLEKNRLLEYDHDNSIYKLHPTIREYAQSMLSAEDRKRQKEKRNEQRDQFIDRFLNEEIDNIEEAIKRFKMMLETHRDEDALYYYRHNLSSMLFKQGVYPQIVNMLRLLFSDGLDAPPPWGDADDQSFIINNLERALTELGRYEESLRLARLANNPTFARSKWDAFVAISRYSLILLDLNRIVDSLHGLTFAEAIIDEVDKGWLLYVYCCFYLRIGDLKRADDYYQQARSCYSSINQANLWRINMALIGTILQLQQGTLTTADFERTLEIIETNGGGKRHLQQLYDTWAQFCWQQGDITNAISYCEKAIVLANQMRSSKEARAHILRATIALAQGDQDHAKQERDIALKQVSQGASVERAIVLANVAKLALQMNDHDVAQHHGMEAFHLAWADGPPYVVAQALENAEGVLTALGVKPPLLNIKTQPADFPFEEDLIKLYVNKSDPLAKSTSQSPTNQEPFRMGFFYWVQVGTVAFFGVNNDKLVETIARKLSSLSTIPGPIQLSRMGKEIPVPSEIIVEGTQQRFSEINWRFEERRVWKKVFVILFIQSTNTQDSPNFAFVNCRLDRLKSLLDRGEQNEMFNLSDDATIVLTGNGLPNISERQKMKRDYLFGEHYVNVRIFPPLSEVT